MLPEISRRCASCGVSIREPEALFCPECGQPLTRKSETALSDQPLAKVEASGNKVSEKKIETEAGARPTASNARPRQDSAASINASGSKTNEPARPSAQPVVYQGGGHEKTRERLHRASSRARGVIGDEVKRVEKIRHVSSAMFEEASYDPSLRFVLVALGIFIVFIILLVLSKVMG